MAFISVTSILNNELFVVGCYQIIPANSLYEIVRQLPDGILELAINTDQLASPVSGKIVGQLAHWFKCCGLLQVRLEFTLESVPRSCDLIDPQTVKFHVNLSNEDQGLEATGYISFNQSADTNVNLNDRILLFNFIDRGVDFSSLLRDLKLFRIEDPYIRSQVITIDFERSNIIVSFQKGQIVVINLRVFIDGFQLLQDIHLSQSVSQIESRCWSSDLAKTTISTEVSTTLDGPTTILSSGGSITTNGFFTLDYPRTILGSLDCQDMKTEQLRSLISHFNDDYQNTLDKIAQHVQNHKPHKLQIQRTLDSRKFSMVLHSYLTIEIENSLILDLEASIPLNNLLTDASYRGSSIITLNDLMMDPTLPENLKFSRISNLQFLSYLPIQQYNITGKLSDMTLTLGSDFQLDDLVIMVDKTVNAPPILSLLSCNSQLDEIDFEIEKQNTSWILHGYAVNTLLESMASLFTPQADKQVNLLVKDRSITNLRMDYNLGTQELLVFFGAQIVGSNVKIQYCHQGARIDKLELEFNSKACQELLMHNTQLQNRPTSIISGSKMIFNLAPDAI